MFIPIILDRRALFLSPLQFLSFNALPVNFLMKAGKLLVVEEGKSIGHLPLFLHHPVIQIDVVQSVSIPVRLKVEGWDVIGEGERRESHSQYSVHVRYSTWLET